MLVTDWVQGAPRLVAGESPIAVMGRGGPVLAWAAAYGRRAGLCAGAAIGLCDPGALLPVHGRPHRVRVFVSFAAPIDIAGPEDALPALTESIRALLCGAEPAHIAAGGDSRERPQ